VARLLGTEKPQSPAFAESLRLEYARGGRRAWWEAVLAITGLAAKEEEGELERAQRLLATELKYAAGSAFRLKRPVGERYRELLASRDLERFLDYLKRARIGWVRVRYLRELGRGGARIPRRQEVPRAELAVAGERGVPEDLGASGRWVVSHPWRSARHPDPDSGQLASLVGELDRLGAADTDLVFYDYASLYQHDVTDGDLWELVQQRRGLWARGAAEKDWPEMPCPTWHRAVRGKAQEAFFRASLREAELLFAWPGNKVLVLPDTDSHNGDIIPGYPADPRPFLQRGWCLFELCVSHLFGTLANGDQPVVGQLLQSAPLEGGPETLRCALFQQARFSCGFDAEQVAQMCSRLYRVSPERSRARSLLASFEDHPLAAGRCTVDYAQSATEDDGRFVVGFEVQQRRHARAGPRLPESRITDFLGTPAVVREFALCLEVELRERLRRLAAEVFDSLTVDPSSVDFWPDHPCGIDLRGGCGEPVYVTCVPETGREAQAGICEGFELVSVERFNQARGRWEREEDFRKLRPDQILRRSRLHFPIALVFRSPLCSIPSLSERQLALRLGLPKVKELHLHRLTRELGHSWRPLDVDTKQVLRNLHAACDDDLDLVEAVVVGGRKLEPGVRLRMAPNAISGESPQLQREGLLAFHLPAQLEFGRPRSVAEIRPKQFRTALRRAGVRWLTEQQEDALLQVLRPADHEAALDSGEEEDDDWCSSLADAFVFDAAGKFTHVGRVVKPMHIMAVTEQLERRLRPLWQRADFDGTLGFRDFMEAMFSGGITWLTREHLGVLFDAMRGEGGRGFTMGDWLRKFSYDPMEAAREVLSALGSHKRRFTVVRGKRVPTEPIPRCGITFGHFQRLVVDAGVGWLSARQLRVLFRSVDKDRSGRITEDELMGLERRRCSLEMRRAEEAEAASSDLGSQGEEEGPFPEAASEVEEAEEAEEAAGAAEGATEEPAAEAGAEAGAAAEALAEHGATGGSPTCDPPGAGARVACLRQLDGGLPGAGGTAAGAAGVAAEDGAPDGASHGDPLGRGCGASGRAGAGVPEVAAKDGPPGGAPIDDPPELGGGAADAAGAGAVEAAADDGAPADPPIGHLRGEGGGAADAAGAGAAEPAAEYGALDGAPPGHPPGAGGCDADTAGAGAAEAAEDGALDGAPPGHPPGAGGGVAGIAGAGATEAGKAGEDPAT